MAAWCPTTEVHYCVSVDEMKEMSTATRYCIRGFLAGNEPAPPIDDEGNEDPDDMDAWRSAVRRFRHTGNWFGRWRTCAECGSVLLPDSVAERCHDHTAAPELESRR